MEDRPRSCLLKQRKPNTRAFTDEIIEKLVEHFRQNGDEWWPTWSHWRPRPGCVRARLCPCI